MRTGVAKLIAELDGRAATASTSVELISGNDVVIEAINWLWPGWLARGKVHIIAGAPGTGKTTLAVAIAAQITSGGTFPDASRCAVGNILIWSGEDTAQDVLLPRFIVNGGDRSRIHFVGDVLDCDGRAPFDPSKDVPLLLKVAQRITGGVSLVIVDPIVSAVAGDSHKNAEVRRGLQPLGDLARALDCAVLGVTHFSKGTSGADPVERVTGSLAFGAVARLIWVAAKEADSPDNARFLIRAKSNIGPDGGGFGYVLDQRALIDRPDISSSVVTWRQSITGAARDLLAKAEPGGDPEERTACDEAREFLREALECGAVPVVDIHKQAASAGISIATLRRAKGQLGVVTAKGGFGSGWRWSLPPPSTNGDAPRRSPNSEDAQTQSVSTLGNDEHLRLASAESECF